MKTIKTLIAVSLMCALSLSSCGLTETQMSDEENSESTYDELKIYPIDETKPGDDAEYKATGWRFSGDELSQLFVYTYDDHDNIIMSEYFDVETGECYDINENTYEYNDDGSIAVEYNGSLMRYRYYEYNDDGSLNTVNEYEGDMLMLSECYSYDEYGGLINLTYTMAGQNTIDFGDYVREYDDKGNVTVSKHYDYTTNELTSICYFTYDENGNLLEERTENEPDSDSPNEYDVTIVTYDGNGNIICNESVLHNENGEETPVSAYEYTYNSDNRLIKQKHYCEGVLEWTTIYEYTDYN